MQLVWAAPAPLHRKEGSSLLCIAKLYRITKTWSDQ